MALSVEQQRFVNHGWNGHARLLAGPGTGKSFTAVKFLEALSDLVEAPRCHMITFTRAATQELQSDFDAHPKQLTEREPSTAHSFALWLLMRKNDQKLRMADDWEKRHLIEEAIVHAMKRQGHDVNIREVRRLTDEKAAGWQSLDEERILLSLEDPHLAAGFSGCWSQAKQVLGFVHVSEIPWMAVQMIEDQGASDVPLDVLVVDEFQDLNFAEVRLLQLLSEWMQIVAIGDDDQSIYSWREAAPSALLDFCDSFTAAPFQLTICRRCPPEILTPAMEVIDRAAGRPAKPRLRSHRPAGQSTFAQLRFADSTTELRGVVDIVRHQIDSGVEAENIALLVRSSAKRYRKALEPELEKHGLRLANVDWVQSALAEGEVRRLLALGRLIVDPEDSLSWMSLLLNTKGVGIGTIMKLYDRACDQGLTFAQVIDEGRRAGFTHLSGTTAGKVMATVLEIDAVLASLQGEYEGAQLDEFGWGGWLLGQGDLNRLSDDATRVFQEVGQLTMTDEPTLLGYLSQLEPLAKDLATAEPGAVRLMSMNQSKGLTVHTAILVGVDSQTVPLPRGNREEERRILYVAMTRATDMCLITRADRPVGAMAQIGGGGFGARSRSPFLTDLPGTVPSPVDGRRFVNELRDE